jgi:hypothetical protein
MMKRKIGHIVAVCTVAVWGLVANSTTATANEIFGYHHDGDRVGRHGMVLFGERNHFVAHIPTFSRPHNEQLILRVVLLDRDGNEIQTNFSAEPHSLRPRSTFSLDDVLLTKGATFVADVHRGNFEHGGAVRFSAVTVRVGRVLVARNLPGAAQAIDGIQEYYVFGEPGDAYLAHYIRSNRAFQQILRVSAVGHAPPFSPNRAVRMTVASATRLAPTPVTVSAGLPKAGAAEPTPVQFKLSAELWCLKGPDFFASCQSS